MTLYRPVHRSGATALPSAFLTMANLFVFSQSNPKDWRVETITEDDFQAEQDQAAESQFATNINSIDLRPHE